MTDFRGDCMHDYFFRSTLRANCMGWLWKTFRRLSPALSGETTCQLLFG